MYGGDRMLLSYSVENFKSFKNEAYISLISNENINDKNKYASNFVKFGDDTDVFRSAVVFGENGGGKSNFFESLKFLQYLFKINSYVQSANNCLYTSNEIFEERNILDTVQSFNVEFFSNGNRYAYYLEIDVMGIREEALYIYKNNTYYCKFEVKRITNIDQYNISELKNIKEIENDIRINEKGVSESWIDDFNKNQNQSEWIGLHVSRLAVMGIKSAIDTVKWFTNNLMIEGSKFYNYDVKFTNNVSDNDMMILNSSEFVDIIKLVDKAIVDIDIDRDKPYYNSYLVRKDLDGKVHKCMLKDESSGVREFFAWATQLYKVIYNGITLIADEIDRSFNATLSSKVLAYVNGTKHNGQLIFTTHNVLHMTFQSFMKGQMFIVTKNLKTLESDIIPLTEYDELTYDNHKVYEFYINGLLGGTVSE